MRFLAALTVALYVAVSPAFAAEPAALAKARQRYNAGDFEGAISAAAVARNIPSSADAASLVIARSHLERYRQRPDPTDLVTARDALFAVNRDNLSPRDQVDLFIGIGQALYLGEMFGAAAEFFDTALTRSTLLPAPDRRQLLDWWATALDREAQTRPQERRSRAFDRIAARMDEELRQDPFNPVASYWLAVAARGSGDPERAWNVAVAGWVRSSLAPEKAQTLREDLDRLVAQALIPERAHLRPPREQQEAMRVLTSPADTGAVTLCHVPGGMGPRQGAVEIVNRVSPSRRASSPRTPRRPSAAPSTPPHSPSVLARLR